MNKPVRLKQALKAWHINVASSEALRENHIPVEEIYDMLINRSDNAGNDDLLAHLSVCSRCFREFVKIRKAIREADLWDMALPKAAASETIDWPKKFMTESGKYAIIIRRSVTDPNKGLVSIQVNPARIEKNKVEGKTEVLKDGKKRELLRQKIIDGEASQEQEDLKSIDFNFVVLAE
jgi:hypothetical protein